MRISILLLWLCIFPTLSWAGVPGSYILDNQFLIKQVRFRWSKKLSKKQVERMVRQMKKMKATMSLSSKGKFFGKATLPGKKNMSIQKGTWKRVKEGKTTLLKIMINEGGPKKKKTSTMRCMTRGKSLFCKGSRSPMIIKFDKVS